MRNHRVAWIAHLFAHEVIVIVVAVPGAIWLLPNLARWITALESQHLGWVVHSISAILVAIAARYVVPIFKNHALFLEFREVCTENDIRHGSPEAAVFLNYLNGFSKHAEEIRTSGVVLGGAEIIEINRACFQSFNPKATYYSVFQSDLFSYINAYPQFNAMLRNELEATDMPVRIIVHDKTQLVNEFEDHTKRNAIVELFRETPHVKWFWVDPLIFSGFQQNIAATDRTFGLWPSHAVMLYVSVRGQSTNHRITLHQATEARSKYPEYVNLLKQALAFAQRLDVNSQGLYFSPEKQLTTQLYARLG